LSHPIFKNFFKRANSSSETLANRHVKGSFYIGKAYRLISGLMPSTGTL
jgi:hypothetical protein